MEVFLMALVVAMAGEGNDAAAEWSGATWTGANATCHETVVGCLDRLGDYGTITTLRRAKFFGDPGTGARL